MSAAGRPAGSDFGWLVGATAPPTRPDSTPEVEGRGNRYAGAYPRARGVTERRDMIAEIAGAFDVPVELVEGPPEWRAERYDRDRRELGRTVTYGWLMAAVSVEDGAAGHAWVVLETDEGTWRVELAEPMPADMIRALVGSHVEVTSVGDVASRMVQVERIP